MKRIVTLLLCFLCSLCLCGYTTTGYSNVELTVAEDFDSSYSTMNTLKINGKFITLPCDVSLFVELGFEPDMEYEVQPRHIMSGVPMFDASGNCIELGLVNNSDSVQNWSKCHVYNLAYTHGGYKDNKIDLAVNGIVPGTTYQAVKDAWGEGVYQTEYDKDFGFTQSFQTPKWDREIMFSYLPDYTLEYISVDTDLPLDYGYESAFSFSSGQDDPMIDYEPYVVMDDYDDYDVDIIEPYGPEGSRDSGMIFGFGALMVIGIFGILIVAVIILIVVARNHKKKTSEFGYTSDEMDAARRLLNTDLEDIADDILDDTNGG